ncbi:MAG: hypothetical protein JWN04_1306 [Myxococcaceae bacterium]|nr:hypothetical protein [Myxococcaceae bacterium]
MQRCFSVLWFFLSPGLLACGAEPTEPSGRSLDGGLHVELDAAADTQIDKRDSGKAPDGTVMLASASAQACAIEPLAALGATCGAADPTEPSSRLHPALLNVDTNCNEVHAWAADKDDDAYRFRIGKSDPVLVELSYGALARASLALRVLDASERKVASTQPTQEPQQQQRTVFQGVADMTYDLTVESALVGTCLPYALRVSPRYCTDAFEDNDSIARSTKLQSSSGPTAAPALRVEATISQGDPDFYQFVTPKADPVLIGGSYTVADGDTLQLHRSVENASGLGTIDVAGTRVGASESFSDWLVSNTQGAVFRARLEATGTGCASYRMLFDVAACSDDYEDNDSETAAATIPIGSSIEASAFRGDDDYYDVSRLTEDGTCTLSYKLLPGAVALRLVVYNGSGGVVTSSADASTAAANGSTSTTAHWLGAASMVAVGALGTNVCQPYTLRCDPIVSPPPQ